MGSRIRIWLALSAWLSILSLGNSASATPQDIFGYGARSPGLAMTGVVTCAGYECVFVNPAGLSRASTSAIYLGLHAGGIRVELDGERFPLDHARASTIGFQLPLPFGGAMRDRLALGAAFYTPQDTVLRNEVLYAEQPQFMMLSRAHVVAIQLGLGMDLDGWADGFRVGVGVSALANTGGQLRVRVDAANRFVSETETQLLAGFAPIIGVTWESDDFGVGLVYRAELRSEIGLDIEVDGLPVELPFLTIGALAQYDPHTIAIEGSWRPQSGLELSAHLTTRLWSVWPGMQTRTSASSFLPPDPGFATTFSPRIAAERTWENDRGFFAIRAGYAYEPTPTPPAGMRQGRDDEGEPRFSGDDPVLLPVRFLDNDRHVGTAGLGVGWTMTNGMRLELDIYGQFHWMPERTHEIPNIGLDTPMQTKGWLLTAGWTLGVGW